MTRKISFSGFRNATLQHRQRLLQQVRIILYKTGRAFVYVFTHHPSETSESYIQHLWFTIKTSLRLVGMGILLFLHGLFPFIFVRTVSTQIERIYTLMRSRIPAARRESIDIQYDI